MLVGEFCSNQRSLPRERQTYAHTSPGLGQVHRGEKKWDKGRKRKKRKKEEKWTWDSTSMDDPLGGKNR